MIKSHEIKNVTDFNVADSVRHDIKVLVTKTRYTVNPLYTVFASGHVLKIAKISVMFMYKLISAILENVTFSREVLF